MRPKDDIPPLDPMRYLKRRGTRWHYIRRVPDRYSHIDDRGLIQVSLKTSSLEIAKLRRDLNERADELYWQGIILSDHKTDAHEARYKAARARAIASGFEYKTASDIAASSPLPEILKRIEVAHASSKAGQAAVLGAIKVPAVTIRKAMERYCDEIGIGELQGKSDYQARKWKDVKMAAAEDFISRIGNKPILEITREDAQRYHAKLMRLVLSKGKDRLSGNTANRKIGNIRKLFRDYARYVGSKADNPFANLSFPDSKVLRKTVLPFSKDHIQKHFLMPGAINKLNKEARLILLALIETGCRPSEICNLTPNRIFLDHEVPHIAIDFEVDRQLKTENSIRIVPLVGVSLEAMRRAPKGFPGYKDKETNFSAVAMKFLQKNNILPSENHRVYSLRHAFEDRMKEAGYDEEFRRRMMGHDTDRPEYGTGGALSWRRDRLAQMALPFDPRIFDGDGPALRKWRQASEVRSARSQDDRVPGRGVAG